MTTPLKLKIIIGSTRPGRVGPSIAAWAAAEAEAHGKFDVEVVDMAEVALPFFDEAAHPIMKAYEHDHTKSWSAKIEEADAFIFVTPEYDGFPPATLVNGLQALVHEWRYKPAGVFCYGGVSGGLKSAQVLRELIGNLGMMAVPAVVPVPFFPTVMSEEGKVTPNEKMSEGAQLQLTELEKWAGALRALHAAA